MPKKEQILPKSIKELCHHCGNRVPFENIFTYSGKILDNDFDETNRYMILKCLTCEKPSLYGQEESLLDIIPEISDYNLLYPKDAFLSKNVPKRIANLYQDAFHLRHKNPDAFANQIRKALEAICSQQEAVGNNLSQKLKDLAKKGRLPGQLNEFTDLIRVVGNIGSHDSEKKLTTSHAELVKDIFLSIIEYLYDAPAKVKALQKKIKGRKKLQAIINSESKND